MLAQKIESGSIVAMKLVSGEEIIGVLDSALGNIKNIALKQPFVIPAGCRFLAGDTLRPFMHSVDTHVTLPWTSLLTGIHTANTAAIAAYRKLVGTPDTV